MLRRSPPPHQIGVWDGDKEVAYATVVLAMLRPGYRCFHLRSRHGTRIEMCYLFVHIGRGTEPHVWAEAKELRQHVQQQQATIAQQQAQINLQQSQLAACDAQLKLLHPLVPPTMRSAELLSAGRDAPPPLTAEGLVSESPALPAADGAADGESGPDSADSRPSRGRLFSYGAGDGSSSEEEDAEGRPKQGEARRTRNRRNHRNRRCATEAPCVQPRRDLRSWRNRTEASSARQQSSASQQTLRAAT